MVYVSPTWRRISVRRWSGLLWCTTDRFRCNYNWFTIQKWLCLTVLCGVQLQYVQQVKYLGVMLVSVRLFIHSISHVKEKFYRCFNAVYFRSRNAGSECVSVQLLKSLCIPIILYSVKVLHLNKSTLASLDNVIDRAVFRIFGCNMTGDIKYIRNMFGLLPVSDIAVCRLRGFLRKYYNCFSSANVIMHATGAFL